MDSYLRNQNSFDVPYESLPKRLKFLASKNTDKTAFVFLSATDDTRTCMSFGELFEKSESFARGLKFMGLGTEDVIGIVDEKSPETLVAMFGVQMLGAIPFILRFVKKDGQFVIDGANRANCSVLIVDLGHMDTNMSVLEKIIGRTSRDGAVFSKCIPKLQKLIIMTTNSNISSLTVQNVINYGRHSSESLPDIDPESTAALFWTSGSSGIPKIIPYTHYSILWNAYNRYFAISRGSAGNDQSVLYSDRPFSWIAGFPSLIFIGGVCMIVLRNTSAVKSIMEMNELTSHIIQSEKCTCAILIAPFLREMLTNESCKLFVDTVVTSGEPVCSALSKCVGKLCNNFVVIYGLTEIGPVTYKHLSNTNPAFETFSIGQPLPGVELKILSKDGKMVPKGDTGNIYVRSPIRFTGYMNHEVETRTTLSKSGWFKTDDLGHILDNGDIVIDGRASEVILIHGKMILPSHLEADVKRHPAVHDVVVSPVPDAASFQQACASVILKPGCFVSGEEMNAFMYNTWKKKDQNIFGTLLKYFPKYYIFCDKFQLNQNGKTDRTAVAKRAVEKLSEMKAF